MAAAKRIQVKGVRRRDTDSEMIALVLWLQAKRLLRDKRAQEAKAKERREAREARS